MPRQDAYVRGVDLGPRAGYPWTTNPGAGYAGLLRPTSSYPDPFLAGGSGRWHTFGNLVGVAAADIRSSHGLTTMTQAAIQSAAAVDGVVEDFYFSGELNLGSWAHGVTLRHFVVDAGGNYGIDANTWSGGAPSAADRSDWTTLENFVIRGASSQPTWNGIARLGAGVYGGWFVMDRWEAYAAKTVGFKLTGGGVDIRRGHCRWLHREGTDHGGGSQILSGTGGLKMVRDVCIDVGIRWQDGSEVNPETHTAGSQGFQTGSLSSKIDYMVFENCYFDSTPGAGTAFNGTADPSSLGGWNSEMQAAGGDPEGYVKNTGYYVVTNCKWGRRANTRKSSGSETTHINDTYYDTGLPL